MDNNRQLLYRKQYWYIIVTVIVISLLFFVISFLDISSSWSNTFLNLSMIILGASIASIIQEYILGEYYKQQYKKNIVESLAPDFNDLKKTVNGAIDKIVKDVTDRTTDSIGDIQKRVAEASDFMLNGINVLKGADIAGIIDIFPNRYSDCHGEETVKDMIIKDFYAEKNMIYLMGISLGDYFLDRGTFKSSLIEMLDNNQLSKSNLTIQTLLLHPKCEALRQRAKWEVGKECYNDDAFYDSTTFIETDGAARIAKRMTQKYRTLEVKLYDQAPTTFLILTSRYAFYETYTYASRGSKVPLIKVQAGVPLYNHLQSHFERIWNDASPITKFDSIKSTRENL